MTDLDAIQAAITDLKVGMVTGLGNVSERLALVEERVKVCQGIADEAKKEGRKAGGIMGAVLAAIGVAIVKLLDWGGK